MSISERKIKFRGKGKIMDFMKITKIGTTMSETCTRPHLESHTQSSMRRKDLPRECSFKSGREVKKSESNIFISKQNSIRKRSQVIKKSNSMQTLKTIVKLGKDQMSSSLQDNQTDTGCQSKQCIRNSLVFMQADLIKDVSQNLKRYSELSNKKTNVDQSEKRVENPHVFSQDISTNQVLDFQQCTNSSAFLSIRHNLSKNEISNGVQSSDNEEESHSKVQLHHKLKSAESKQELEDIFLNEKHSVKKLNTAISVSTDTNVMTNQKDTRKICINGKSTIQSDVSNNLQGNTGPRNTKLSKCNKHDTNTRDKNIPTIVGNNVPSNQKKYLFKKNVTSINQRVWKPAGINRVSNVENFNSITKSICAKQTKTMQENRNPHVDRVTKICKHLVEIKEEQKLQKEVFKRSFPSSNSSKTSDSKILDKRDDLRSIKRRSKSVNWQTQSLIPKRNWEAQNGIDYIEPTLVQKKRIRSSQVIDALKEIIDSTEEDENIIEVVTDVSKNKILKYETTDCEISECGTSSRMLLNDKLNFTKIKDSDTEDQSVSRVFWKSIGIQVNLDRSSFLKNDFKGDPKKILTQTVGTQTSPYNNNVVEVGCNTTSYNSLRKDMTVSCDLMDLMETNHTTTIEDKLMSANDSIHIMESPVIYIRTNIENGYSDESKESISISECQETSNTEMSLKIENHINSDSFNTHDANKNNLSLQKSCHSSLTFYDYDASCSSSSEEHLINDVRYKDIIVPELKVNNISSSLIAAFELAAERARNIHKAIILYNESLNRGIDSRKSDWQNKETEEDCETSNICNKDQYCTPSNAFLVKNGSENSVKSEYEMKCHFIVTNNRDFDEISMGFSSSGSSDKIYKLESENFKDYLKIGQEQTSAIFPRTEKTIANSLLNKCSNFVLDNVESLMSMPRTQEKYALEVLKIEEVLDGNDRGFEIEKYANKISAFPAIGEILIISRKHLFPLICCVLCTIVFWCLQFSFTCHSAM